MIEWDIPSEKIVNTIQYPEGMKPARQYCCNYNGNIYLIDGENGEIILFDPMTKTFTKKCEIPLIGRYPSAVVMVDKIHIFYGKYGSDSKRVYLIYDILTNKLSEYAHKFDKALCRVSVIKYKHRIIAFGGSDGRRLNTLWVSSEIGPDDEFRPKWTIKEDWKLPKRTAGCGHILYKDYIIVLGGSIGSGGSRKDSEAIYLLDLRSDNGWIELKHIKCPLQSEYLAINISDSMVHLFVAMNKWPNWQESVRGHYSIHISTLLGSEFSR